MSEKKLPWLVPHLIGIFFGALLGFAANDILFSPKPKKETFREAQERERQHQHGRQTPRGGNQRGGAEDPRARDPHARGGAEQPPQQDRAQASAAKAHFMKKFVAALVSKPGNSNPNPEWSSPVKEGTPPISCADCHDPAMFNIDAMKQMDPGAEAVEKFRQSKEFMVGLMKKWVARLNTRHGGRLKEKVTCTTCHATDPSAGMTPGLNRQQRGMVFAYFMTRFVSGLKEKPTSMKEPASKWQPLLKEGSTIRCSTCHTDSTINMDPLMDAKDKLQRPRPYAENLEFMTHLMEEWVSKLNRVAGGSLTKAVVCKDCHERDPRR
jgi:formate-dependent nitrite reductase cytochrome c552 subunit